MNTKTQVRGEIEYRWLFPTDCEMPNIYMQLQELLAKAQGRHGKQNHFTGLNSNQASCVDSALQFIKLLPTRHLL